jgi:hypothetical protein
MNIDLEQPLLKLSEPTRPSSQFFNSVRLSIAATTSRPFLSNIAPVSCQAGSVRYEITPPTPPPQGHIFSLLRVFRKFFGTSSNNNDGDWHAQHNDVDSENEEGEELEPIARLNQEVLSRAAGIAVMLDRLARLNDELEDIVRASHTRSECDRVCCPTLPFVLCCVGFCFLLFAFCFCFVCLSVDAIVDCSP